MKDMKLLVWLTQLGVSVAMPLAGFVFLGVWLHRSLGWGQWVEVLGVALGIVTALRSLWDTLRIMLRMSSPEPEEPPEAFNDHI